MLFCKKKSLVYILFIFNALTFIGLFAQTNVPLESMTLNLDNDDNLFEPQDSLENIGFPFIVN